MSRGLHRPKQPKQPSTRGAKRPRVAQTEVGTFSTLAWDKVVRDAPWVSRQSMNLHPGDPSAVSKYRHSKKFVARNKKVIRPRISKVAKKAGAPDGQKTQAASRSSASWRSGGVATDKQRRSAPGGKI